MRRIRLFIADVDSTHISRTVACIKRRQGIEIAGCSGDGFSAYRQILTVHPDVLLTDIQLPGLDGIMLLKDLSETSRPPAAIVCTSFYSTACVTAASRCGARYCLYKPLDYNRLPDVIEVCARRINRPAPGTGSQSGDPAKEQPDVCAALRALLREIGIPARLSGSVYLTEALAELLESDSSLRNLSKGLYADIAERANSSVATVERSLRLAISTAYTRGSLNTLFPSKPTNLEFLRFLLDRMRELQHPLPAASAEAAQSQR